MTRPPRLPAESPTEGDAASSREKAQPARIPNNLLALGSAAVLTIYGAGFQRTRAAADKFANEADAHTRPTQQILESPGPGRPSASAAASAAPTPPVERSAKPQGAERTADAKVAASVTAPTVGAPSVTATAAPSAPEPAAPAAAAPASVAAAPVVEAPKPTPTQSPAPTPTQNAPEAEKPRASPWRDGSYTGWGTSRHGDIEATVVIAEGRIVSAQISRCLTRYSCSWIAHLQQQVVVRQSADVDFVSGATQSTNAFYYAVVEALKKAS